MAKVMLICGKIASGKSFYCRRLMERAPALLLSVDEVTQRVFDKGLGRDHDRISGKIQGYLLDKAAEAVRLGVDVVLDWGFWRKADREKCTAFFRERGIATEWHYIEVGGDVWRMNIARRNEAVLAGEDESYYVDEGLLEKLRKAFEEPQPGEMDVIFRREELAETKKEHREAGKSL